MVAAKQKFNAGDLVFGKVKGYSPWPARITSITSKDRYKCILHCKYNDFRYKVYFYGTHDTGTLKGEDVWPYNADTKAKFTPKNLKKKGYSEGIGQVQMQIQS